MQDWMDRYQDDMREQINWIRYHRYEDIEKTKSICEQLVGIGNETQDASLKGFARYNLAEMYYVESNFKNALYECEVALHSLESSDAQRTYARACNLLGVIYLQNGSIELCVDYFLQGINACRKNGYYHNEGIFYINLGSIYGMLDETEKALECYLKADVLVHKEEELPIYQYRALVLISLSIAQTYLSLEQYDEAKKYIDLTQQYFQSDIKFDHDIVDFNLAKLLYHLHFNEEEQIQNCIKEIKENFFNSPYMSDVWPSFTQSIELIHQNNRDDLILELSSIIDFAIHNDVAIAIKIQLLKILWNMEKDKSSKKAISLSTKLLSLYEEKEKHETQTKSSSIQALINRNKRMVRYAELVEYANKDSLTSLYNKRYFNELFATKKQEAILNHTSLAIGIMDVDSFKQYNDTYGHIQGDYCLQEIADIFHSLTNQSLTFSRFGGDEFVFLMENNTTENLVNVAKEIQQLLTAKHLDHEKNKNASYVTVSIGMAYFANIHENTKLENMIHEADTCLYHVKQDSSITYQYATFH